MLILSFLHAAALLALGILGLGAGTSPEETRALGLPGLYFGGGTLFCALFALKEPRHGLAGASFLAFLAFLTSAASLVGPMTRGDFDWSAPRDRIHAAVWAASTIYLTCAVISWKRRRRAATLAEITGAK